MELSIREDFMGLRVKVPSIVVERVLDRWHTWTDREPSRSDAFALMIKFVHDWLARSLRGQIVVLRPSLPPTADVSFWQGLELRSNHEFDLAGLTCPGGVEEIEVSFAIDLFKFYGVCLRVLGERGFAEKGGLLLQLACYQALTYLNTEDDTIERVTLNFF